MSICPAQMTIVMPSAIKPVVLADCVNILLKLRQRKKLGLTITAMVMIKMKLTT